MARHKKSTSSAVAVVNQDPDTSMAYRDVHGSQQLGRQRLEKPATNTWWHLGSYSGGAASALAAWVLLSSLQFVVWHVGGIGSHGGLDSNLLSPAASVAGRAAGDVTGAAGVGAGVVGAGAGAVGSGAGDLGSVAGNSSLGAGVQASLNAGDTGLGDANLGLSGGQGLNVGNGIDGGNGLGDASLGGVLGGSGLDMGAGAGIGTGRAPSSAVPGDKGLPAGQITDGGVLRQAVQAVASGTGTASPGKTMTRAVFSFRWWKLGLSLLVGIIVGYVIRIGGHRRTKNRNLLTDTTDLNQYEGEPHILFPAEVYEMSEWVPDAGDHYYGSANAILSHAMLEAKGLGTVQLARRAKADVIDTEGNIVYYKGDMLLDNDGEPIFDTVPMIDTDFGEQLWTDSKVRVKKEDRIRVDASKIDYQPDLARRGGYTKVADMIRAEWFFPPYEVQRPAGAYIVDSDPVNVLLIAITRGNKGQSYIEPMIDIWTRQFDPDNIVVNDAKGELLRKFYVPMVTRGYDVVQFNLMQPLNTDVWNPLGVAAEFARQGDFDKAASSVENLAEIFFPLTGGQEPVWANAANNAFKRSAYGLIDFYMEEERQLRIVANATGMSPDILDQKLDVMWGKVTLYNCYQFFVEMASRNIKNPVVELERRVRDKEFDVEGGEELLNLAKQDALAREVLWNGKEELDMLTLYFNATDRLPVNSMRKLIGNADKSLRAMANAEKMLSSVYGIAVTEMVFFADPTIATLTSGLPSQNTDLGSFSFPRQLGVRFAAEYMNYYNLLGLQVNWSAYGDNRFTENLGPDFMHTDIVGREGWARYYFKGIFPAEQVWLKLELLNAQTKMLVNTFYFTFTKRYLLTPNGRHLVQEPVTGRNIARGGIIQEVRPVYVDGEIARYEPGNSEFPKRKVDYESYPAALVESSSRIFITDLARYSEAPKALFLITPPHLTKYAKLFLIAIKQLMDLSFSQSYMTKADQKPLYKTRFMLDELGNLQSDGHGIANLQTILSIALGQDQLVTMAIQTLQQLKDIYGDSVDKIIQGNVAVIIFLRSTDDVMIDSFVKSTGTVHVGRRDTRQVQVDNNKPGIAKVSSSYNVTLSVKEEPLLHYNVWAYMPPMNNIVLKSGEFPRWNRGQNAAPMAHSLHRNQIMKPGSDYTLNTNPTTSTARLFDVRTNLPNLYQLFDKRMGQAYMAPEATDLYRELFGYDDADVLHLDPDSYSDEIMALVDSMLAQKEGTMGADGDSDDGGKDYLKYSVEDHEITDNEEFLSEKQNSLVTAERTDELIYAGGTVSRFMLTGYQGKNPGHGLDDVIVAAYKAAQPEMDTDHEHFSVNGAGSLCDAAGTVEYITMDSREMYEAMRQFQEAAADADSRVHAEEDTLDGLSEEELSKLTSGRVHPEFYYFLAKQDNWDRFAGGAFERTMAVEMRRLIDS